MILMPNEEAISGSVTVAFQASPCLVWLARSARPPTRITLVSIVNHSACLRLNIKNSPRILQGQFREGEVVSTKKDTKQILHGDKRTD